MQPHIDQLTSSSRPDSKQYLHMKHRPPNGHIKQQQACKTPQLCQMMLTMQLRQFVLILPCKSSRYGQLGKQRYYNMSNPVVFHVNKSQPTTRLPDELYNRCVHTKGRQHHRQRDQEIAECLLPLGHLFPHQAQAEQRRQSIGR